MNKKASFNADCILAYDCERNEWEKLFSSKQHRFSTLTCTNGILYLMDNRAYLLNQCIITLDIRSPKTQTLSLFKDRSMPIGSNITVCAFDKKIAVSSSNYQSVLLDTFRIYDITANSWLKDVKPMNIAHVNHSLIHRNGFVYAVENNVPNEKYDLKSNEWITIPALPRRVGVEYSDGIKTLSIGRVFGADVQF